MIRKFTSELIVDSAKLEGFNEYVNEGLFDFLMSFFSKIVSFFKNKKDVATTFENEIKKSNSDKFSLASLKSGDEIIIKLNKPLNEADASDVENSDDETPSKDGNTVYIGLLKVGNLTNDSSVFQMVGTTSDEFLSNLVKSKNMEDLIKNNVMVILSGDFIHYNKPLQAKIVKNISKGGGTFKSSSNIAGVVNKR